MSELIPADAAVSPWRASAERVTKGEGVASGTRWRISGGTPGPRFWMRPERRSASPHRCKTAILRAAGRTPTPVEVEGDVLTCLRLDIQLGGRKPAGAAPRSRREQVSG